MKVGICTKCKRQVKVIMHHAHGYDNEHKDDVLPYCHSCHRNVHIEARKSGKCKIHVSELSKLSHNSAVRRINKENCRQISFYETMLPNVQLQERIQVWSDRIHFAAYFQAEHGKKLYEVDI